MTNIPIIIVLVLGIGVMKSLLLLELYPDMHRSHLLVLNYLKTFDFTENQANQPFIRAHHFKSKFVQIQSNGK